jgi:hypothetical protein
VYFCFICYQPDGLLYIHDSIQLSDFQTLFLVLIINWMINALVLIGFILSIVKVK